MATYIQQPVVTDSFRNSVIEALGYPIIDEETIYGIYSKEHIDEYIIGECMEKFFNYFPVIREVDFPSTSSESEIESPIENVLGVVHYSMDDSSNNVKLDSGNPFYTASVTSVGTGFNTYGTPFNYNQATYSSYQQNFYLNAMKNVGGKNQFYLDYIPSTNKFRFRSAIGGNIHAQIGCYSDNVEDIDRTKRSHFLSICRATLMTKFAKVIKLAETDLPLEIDADTLLDEGKDILETEYEWLENNSTIALMR